MKYEGILNYDGKQERYMITFDNRRPIWLHCGDCFDVFSSGQWIGTSIEATPQGKWYLTDTQIRPNSMDGLRVRVEDD